MNAPLTPRIIKSLCGELSYKKGEAYCRAGKVSFTHCDPEAASYEATVGAVNCRVTVEIGHEGEVKATCACPTLSSFDKYCKHVAAVLLYIHDTEQPGSLPVGRLQSEDGFSATTSSGRAAASDSAIAAGNLRLTNSVLGLFVGKPLIPTGSRPRFDTRMQLEVEFTCTPFAYSYRKYMFGIGLKVGPKRLYIVQNIREFLERVERRQAYVFTKHFTYDPELHSFKIEDDAILRQLFLICRNEKMYRETSNTFSVQPGRMSGERMLLIPPFSWETLLPLLAAAPSAQLEQDGYIYEGVCISDEPIPLRFDFDQAPGEGYRLDVQGLDEIRVMEAYGLVLAEGKLLKLPPDSSQRLSELKQMLDSARTRQLQISADQIEPFIEKAIPGLMKLGTVHVAQAVSDRIMRISLKAKLYLDRVRDRLLAGLEFHYGDIVLNPLEEGKTQRGEGRILVRDGEKERAILELMEQSAFVRTEGGYFLDGEDEEYEFMYRILPQLEKLVDVYATSAVKVRLHTGHVPPKIRVDVDERIDWLEIKFDIDGIPEAEIRKVLKSLEEKRRYHRLPHGALLPLESDEFQEIVRFMNEMGIRQADVKGTELRLSAVRGLHLIDAREQGGRAVSLGKSLRRLLENIRNPDNLDFPLPDRLIPVLRDYQKYGYGWLKTLAHYRFGGILADDMGLGKTLQSIAFLVSVLPEIRDQRQPALVVAPASLLYNWRNELSRFAPELRAVIADGSSAVRGRVLKELSHADVVITSYPLLRRDIGRYAGQAFHTLILDEAQAFKNYATQTAQAVKAIRARYRFALTGTPVENSLEELWSIFDAVFPELFPDRKAFGELSRETVAKRARPFLLRRVKSDVLKELPEKIESLQASELLPEQKKLYVAYLAKLQKEALKHLDADTFQQNRIKILAGITRLRQLCCHPALFVEGYTGSSAKFEQLLELVEECRSAGRRMLVFSQFTEMLGLIGRELGYRGVPYFYLDGKTPSAERFERCRRFNEGERDLFLISLKAGGTGLNLTGADTVILYDLWWNPAVEQQAMDRAHRIGQKKVVQVIRLVTQGSVEDKMYEIQQRKKHLIDEVIQPGEEGLSALTERDVRELLMLE
ncbi:DEAD/DEAH box helicase [Paenibacillus sp. MZ04-78.2]|uniref:DEAD/DEAH box helicase n=1 Tax=Paenibacillus sp. MZ04-78.2 TaxID=2962034 RepID=UPI0020B72019|nr:SNF2 helicase associated domain-containing protein [Paenibacillus sp. MZ04-78.2]MCP3774097.1 DEAD/DEAH box helicase [Paenibacillus sp. MZ04-78.2]